MNVFLSSRGLFILGIVILLATNVVVLAGVASNRSGDPEATVLLSHRELTVPYRSHRENSGFSLRLNWRTLKQDREGGYYYGWRTPAWLDKEKLEALGFEAADLYPSNQKYAYKRPLPKKVFLVLEFDGPAHERSLEMARQKLEKVRNRLPEPGAEKKHQDAVKNARKKVEAEQSTESRLFAIDAGLDPDALRKQYDNRTRYIVAPGIVKAGYRYNDKKNEPYGYIQKLGVEQVHVPLKFKQQVEDAVAKKGTAPIKTAHTIELAWGRRFEPWIRSVHLVNK